MFLNTLFLLLLSALIIDTLKIGISKPTAPTENATTESIETITPDTTTTPTTTTVSTTISTSTRKVQIPSTTPATSTTPTKTTKTTTTTTPIPSTTTTAAPDLNTRPSPIRAPHSPYSGYFCHCDLRHKHCDINCCCDIDCIAEELTSFNCQREEARLENINFQQGLPPCKINEGWLCVFRNNFDDSKHKEFNYVVDSAALHEWPQLLLETNELSQDRSYYKSGEPILLYNLDSNEIIEYDIPFSLLGYRCQVFESIRHLTSQNTSCHMTLEKAQTIEAMIFQKLCTSFLLERPSNQIPVEGLIKDTQTEFIPITLFRCTKDFDCVSVSLNSSSLDGLEDSEYSSLIQTKIYHNITNLVSCDVFFVRSEHKSEQVWQYYEVNFIHINESDTAAVNVSGPLGYNAGSPLIIGHKVLLNKTAEHIDSNLIINYFHPNRTDAIHIYTPRRRQGRCEGSQLTVNFGESILVQCSVELENSTELNGETNFTRICGDLQTQSLQFLQGTDILELQEDYLIAVQGYPTNKTDRWIKIEVKNFEHLPVVGAYLDKEYAFVCQNMVLGLKYEFLTARDDVQGVPHQNVVKRATIDVGRRHDLQFQLDETISIPITFSVVFQDLREVSHAIRWSSSCQTFLLSVLVLTYAC